MIVVLVARHFFLLIHESIIIHALAIIVVAIATLNSISLARICSGVSRVLIGSSNLCRCASSNGAQYVYYQLKFIGKLGYICFCHLIVWCSVGRKTTLEGGE